MRGRQGARFLGFSASLFSKFPLFLGVLYSRDFPILGFFPYIRGSIPEALPARSCFRDASVYILWRRDIKGRRLHDEKQETCSMDRFSVHRFADYGLNGLYSSAEGRSEDRAGQNGDGGS